MGAALVDMDLDSAGLAGCCKIATKAHVPALAAAGYKQSSKPARDLLLSQVACVQALLELTPPEGPASQDPSSMPAAAQHVEVQEQASHSGKPLTGGLFARLHALNMSP